MRLHLILTIVLRKISQSDNRLVFSHHLIQINVDNIDILKDKIVTTIKETFVITFVESNLNFWDILPRSDTDHMYRVNQD